MVGGEGRVTGAHEHDAVALDRDCVSSAIPLQRLTMLDSFVRITPKSSDFVGGRDYDRKPSRALDLGPACDWPNARSGASENVAGRCFARGRLPFGLVRRSRSLATGRGRGGRV
ncbi:MAG: hypothetical protein QOG53_3326 [Frankiales bacterium]|nr:hypothetical protein [Frankiales bacterium]